MLQRQTLMSKFPTLTEKTEVYCSDDEKLGKIVEMTDNYFVVEKGLFFPRDFTVRYDDVQEVRDNKMYLKFRKDELRDWRDASYSGWSQVDDINENKINARPLPEYQDRYSYLKEDIRVPVKEEKLDTQKHFRQAGEVSLRKVVHTELRHFTIPVIKEEVRIERTPATTETRAAGTADETAFQEKTIKVPVMEEEVTISKRPVVKEEIHVKKDQVTEQRDVSEQVKKEEVEIQEQGKIKRKAG